MLRHHSIDPQPQSSLHHTLENHINTIILSPSHLAHVSNLNLTCDLIRHVHSQGSILPPAFQPPLLPCAHSTNSSRFRRSHCQALHAFLLDFQAILVTLTRQPVNITQDGSYMESSISNSARPCPRPSRNPPVPLFPQSSSMADAPSLRVVGPPSGIS